MFLFPQVWYVARFQMDQALEVIHRDDIKSDKSYFDGKQELASGLKHQARYRHKSYYNVTLLHACCKFSDTFFLFILFQSLK